MILMRSIPVFQFQNDFVCGVLLLVGHSIQRVSEDCSTDPKSGKLEYGIRIFFQC